MDKKKLKIAFLSRYVSQVNRGAETYVLELSKRLKKNYPVDILSGRDADSLSKMIGGKYDLVIPTNGRMQAIKASLGRIPGGYKTLISGQSGIGRDDIWNIAVTCPDVYVALTDHERNWAKKWAWKSKIVKIPNGVDLEKFNPKGEKIEFDLPGMVILSVGALEWYKHHERTIRAMSKVQNASLLIIGAGPQKKELEEMGNSLLGNDRFKILSVNFEEIPKYYHSADLFVLPSWDREAFGIVYVEAMASNLPVVAPDDLVRREIVGTGGILVDTEDPDKYASAINEALSKIWGDIPRKQAGKFSWDTVAESYGKLFKELLS